MQMQLWQIECLHMILCFLNFRANYDLINILCRIAESLAPLKIASYSVNGKLFDMFMVAYTSQM